MGRLIICISVLILMGSCTVCKSKCLNNMNYDVISYSQIVSYEGRIDTVQYRDTILRNAHIFLPGKKLEYESILFSSSNEVVSSKKVTIVGTNERTRNDSLLQMKIKMYFESDDNDSILFHKYTNNSSCCKWKDSIVDGIIENEKSIWMHPIRSNQYLQTEICGFPEVLFPISVGQKWNNNLSIPPGLFGDWQNSNLENNYIVLGHNEYFYRKKKINVWEIEVKTIVNQKQEQIHTLRYLFNEEIGFIEMNYDFSDGSSIRFKLL